MDLAVTVLKGFDLAIKFQGLIKCKCILMKPYKLLLPVLSTCDGLTDGVMNVCVLKNEWSLKYKH